MGDRSFSDSHVPRDVLKAWAPTCETNKIRLIIDVPYTDHPYLIGPTGRKCQQLMDKHHVLIHFPDCNRNQNGPKINHVMLFGSAKHVEEVRRELRERLPVRIAANLLNVDAAEKMMNKAEDIIRANSRPVAWRLAEDLSSCVFKTEFRSHAYLQEIIDLCIPEENGKSMYMISAPVLPLINAFNQSLSETLLGYIYDQTGARIFFPPPLKQIHAAPFYFMQSSSPTDTVKAYHYLLGLTTMQMMFVVPKNTTISKQQRDRWRKEFLIDTVIEEYYDTNVRQKLYRAHLRFFEFCIKHAYTVRSDILRLRSVVYSASYGFMDDLRRVISHDVFDTCQIFFPLNISEEDYYKREPEKEPMEVFKEFYGEIPDVSFEPTDDRIHISRKELALSWKSQCENDFLKMIRDQQNHNDFDEFLKTENMSSGYAVSLLAQYYNVINKHETFYPLIDKLFSEESENSIDLEQENVDSNANVIAKDHGGNGNANDSHNNESFIESDNNEVSIMSDINENSNESYNNENCNESEHDLNDNGNQESSQINLNSNKISNAGAEDKITLLKKENLKLPVSALSMPLPSFEVVQQEDAIILHVSKDTLTQGLIPNENRLDILPLLRKLSAAANQFKRRKQSSKDGSKDSTKNDVKDNTVDVSKDYGKGAVKDSTIGDAKESVMKDVKVGTKNDVKDCTKDNANHSTEASAEKSSKENVNAVTPVSEKSADPPVKSIFCEKLNMTFYPNSDFIEKKSANNNCGELEQNNGDHSVDNEKSRPVLKDGTQLQSYLIVTPRRDRIVKKLTTPFYFRKNAENNLPQNTSEKVDNETSDQENCLPVQNKLPSIRVITPRRKVPAAETKVSTPTDKENLQPTQKRIEVSRVFVEYLECFAEQMQTSIEAPLLPRPEIKPIRNSTHVHRGGRHGRATKVIKQLKENANVATQKSVSNVEFVAPVVQKQVHQSPVVQQQVYQSPVVQQQVHQSPVVQQQVYQSPVVQQQVYHSPGVQQQVHQSNIPYIPPGVQNQVQQSNVAFIAPVVQQQVYQSPVVQQQVYQSPVVQKQVYQSPVVQQQVYHSPVVQQQVHQSPVVQQHVYQSPVVQEQVYQSPVVQQQVYHSPVVQQQVHQSNIPYIPPGVQNQVQQSNVAFIAPVVPQQVYQSPVVQQQVYQSPVVQKQVYQSPVGQEQVYQSPVIQHIVQKSNVPYAVPVVKQQVYPSPVMHNQMQSSNVAYISPVEYIPLTSDSETILSDQLNASIQAGTYTSMQTSNSTHISVGNEPQIAYYHQATHDGQYVPNYYLQHCFTQPSVQASVPPIREVHGPYQNQNNRRNNKNGSHRRPNPTELPRFYGRPQQMVQYRNQKDELIDEAFDPEYLYDLPPETLFVLVNPMDLPPLCAVLLEVCRFYYLDILSYAYMVPLETYRFFKKHPTPGRVVIKGESHIVAYEVDVPPRLAFDVEFVPYCEELVSKYVPNTFPKPRIHFPPPKSEQQAQEFVSINYGFDIDPSYNQINMPDAVPTFHAIKFDRNADVQWDLDPQYGGVIMHGQFGGMRTV